MVSQVSGPQVVATRSQLEQQQDPDFGDFDFFKYTMLIDTDGKGGLDLRETCIQIMGTLRETRSESSVNLSSFVALNG